MAKKKAVDQPYLLMKAVGALTKYRHLSSEDAFRYATLVLQSLGLMRPGTHNLTRWGKDLERRFKISRSRRKK